MDGTRRLIVGGTIAAGGMLLGAALILGAGVAKADGSPGDRDGALYAQELTAAGLPNDTATANQLASVICETRWQKTSEADTIKLEHDGSGYPTPKATIAVTGAEFHFCPQYSVKLTTGGAP
jgi:hypothetical protein